MVNLYGPIFKYYVYEYIYMYINKFTQTQQNINNKRQ